MIRCCLCREQLHQRGTFTEPMEKTNLPGSGYRCVDHDACTTRIREIIAAHKALAEVCE